jgi:uncharacterized protein (DUF58 family)
MTESLLSPSVLASIGRLDLIAKTVVEGYLLGLHRSPFRGLSQEFAEHRQYMPGDEVRHIDWRLYGRTDRLYVKKFEEETNASVRLLLDASGSLRYAPRGVTKLQYAKFLAASLAYIAVRQNDRVGLTVFNEGVIERLPTRASQRHLQSMLATLDRLSAEGKTRIGQTLLGEAAHWQRKGIAILISDLYDDPAQIIASASRIRRVGHNLIVIHLLDSIEKSLNGGGVYEFHDLETGERLIADGTRIRRAYVESLENRRKLFRREFASAGVEYAEFDTAEPLDKALGLFLRTRKMRGAA